MHLMYSKVKNRNPFMSMKQDARSNVMIIVVQRDCDISPKNKPYEPLKTRMVGGPLGIFTRCVEPRVRRSHKYEHSDSKMKILLYTL